jgi:hypothetical protein
MSLFSRIVVPALLLFVVTPAHASRPCPPDLDCNGAVAVEDLLGLLGVWGSHDMIGDLDGSGTVDVGDLLMMLSFWGPCVFDYGIPSDDPEAGQIALEMLGPEGPLLADEADYERIVADLAAIRTEYPSLARQFHWPGWRPDRLIVQVLHGIAQDDYRCLNGYYQVIEETLLFTVGGADWYSLTFAGELNVARLAVIYAAVEAVGIAEPDGSIGGPNFWIPTVKGEDLWRWEIDDGWHDCFDGCDCHHMYEIQTTGAGDITLIDFQELGPSWCEFR